MPRPYALPNLTPAGAIALLADNNGGAAGSVGYLTLTQIATFSVSTLATVATSGSYTDLINKPTIPPVYSLPNASPTTLGGVKVGANLSIDGAGVLSSSSPTNGTVTSASVVTSNGVSATVATQTTTPAFTFTLGAITPTSVVSSGNITGLNLSGTNTGDATITLTGNVTGTGTGSFATTISASSVTLPMHVALAPNSIIGNNTGVAATPVALSTVQVKALLAIATTDVSGLATVAATGAYSDLIGKPTIPPAYSLPIATATVLGGVKQGGGIAIDGAGVISATGGTGTVTAVSITAVNGVSGSVLNATTTPAISLTLGAITPTSIVASGTITGSNLSGSNTGDQVSITGNAGTATALQTPRAINGVNFDGTAAITVTAAAGTLTGTAFPIAVVTSSLTSVGTLTGGATGAGFTVALSSSIVTGNLPVAQVSGLAVIATSGSAADLTTGILPAARHPALLGDVTSAAGAVTTTLASTGVAANTYTSATVAVDAKGRITAASNGLAGRPLRDSIGLLTIQTLSTTGTVTVDVAVNTRFLLAPTGNVTLSLANDADSVTWAVFVRASAFTVTYPSTVKWTGGVAPTLPTVAGRVMMISFTRLAAGEYIGTASLEAY